VCVDLDNRGNGQEGLNLTELCFDNQSDKLPCMFYAHMLLYTVCLPQIETSVHIICVHMSFLNVYYILFLAYSLYESISLSLLILNEKQTHQ